MLFFHTLLHFFVLSPVLLQQCVTQAEVVLQAKPTTTLPTKISTTPLTPTTTDPGLIGLPTLPTEPEVVVYPASCRSEGTWFIQGGFNGVSYNQFFSLDLTKAWNTTYAPWVQYPDAPPLSTQNCLFASKAESAIRFNDINNAFSTNISSSPILPGTAIGPAGSVLAFIGNENKGHPLITVFNMTTGTWHYNASSVVTPIRNAGIVVIANPLDGRMYMRGGHQHLNADTMDIYDPKKDALTSLPLLLANDTIPSIAKGGPGIPPAQWYTACWSKRRSSILYLGGRHGYTDKYTSPEIIEYKPDTNTWALLPVTGTAPSEREDACMVTDKDNNRVVVFGGQNTNGSLSDIYVLDMNTLVWTRGPGSGTGRIGMACAMYNDGFLTWGGATETFLIDYPGTAPLVLNLTTMRWTDRYNQKGSQDEDLATSSTGGSKLGLILGLSIGLFAIVALAGGVYLFRREKRKTALDYDKILNGKGLSPSQIQSQGSSSHSGTTRPHEQGTTDPGQSLRAALVSTPQPGRQTRHLSASRALDRNSRGRHSGSDCSGRDDVSIRTATSGKYVQETDDELISRKGRRRRQQEQHDRPNSRLGHKIEMSSMGPQGDGTTDIATSTNRYGGPTNISSASPSRAIAPYAAPSAPPNPDIQQR
ncbi:Acyl-CoA-binding domain-containing protein 5 [Linnemannia elongata]|nr:Acyl-CoA-binding domain-containing protein 5 [Linnemannia elongata]